jgi:hypothetical protein
MMGLLNPECNFASLWTVTGKPPSAGADKTQKAKDFYKGKLSVWNNLLFSGQRNI